MPDFKHPDNYSFSYTFLYCAISALPLEYWGLMIQLLSFFFRKTIHQKKKIVLQTIEMVMIQGGNDPFKLNSIPSFSYKPKPNNAGILYQ